MTGLSKTTVIFYKNAGFYHPARHTGEQGHDIWSIDYLDMSTNRYVYDVLVPYETLVFLDVATLEAFRDNFADIIREKCGDCDNGVVSSKWTGADGLERTSLGTKCPYCTELIRAIGE